MVSNKNSTNITLITFCTTLATTDDIPNINFKDGLLDGNFDRNTGTISLAPYATAAAGHLSSTTKVQLQVELI